MIDQWIKKLSDALAPDSTNGTGRGSLDAASANAIERVSATLLIEIARADHEIDAIELVAIRQALQQSSTTLSTQDIDEITELALKDADLSVSLHDQVRVILATARKKFSSSNTCGRWPWLTGTWTNTKSIQSASFAISCM